MSWHLIHTASSLAFPRLPVSIFEVERRGKGPCRKCLYFVTNIQDIFTQDLRIESNVNVSDW